MMNLTKGAPLPADMVPPKGKGGSYMQQGMDGYGMRDTGWDPDMTQDDGLWQDQSSRGFRGGDHRPASKGCHFAQ
eukprot:159712-Amphidinium_carterae.1